MWQWLVDNSGALSAAANIAIVAIWAVYLQLFLAGYRRERRSKILLSSGAGSGLDARCMVSNMSSEPIHVIDVVATIHACGDTWRSSIADCPEQEDDGGGHLHRLTRQGPLKVGEMRDLGRFRTILGSILHATDAPARAGCDPCIRLELTLVAIYGPEDLPVAARRKFVIERTIDGASVGARYPDTEQIRARHARRRLRDSLGEAG